MKSSSSIQLTKAWWKKEQPKELTKSASAFEKAVETFDKLAGGMKPGVDAGTIKKFEQAITALEQAAKQVVSEAQGLMKKASDKDDLKNTIAVMGKPLARELDAARDLVGDLEEEGDDEDEAASGAFGDLNGHSAYVKKYAGKLKRAPYSFALSVPSNDPMEMRLALHKKKGGRALGGMLKKATGSRKFTFGIASSEAIGGDDEEGSNRTLLLDLHGRRVPGLAKRVKMLLRALNVSAYGKVKILVGGAEIESADEATDDLLDPLELDETEDDGEETEQDTPPPPPPPPPANAKQVERALAQLIKRITALDPEAAQPLGASAREIAAMLRTGQVNDAQDAVKVLAEQVLAAEKAGGSDTASGDPMAIWRRAKEAADSGISALQSALRSHGHPDLMRIAEYGLNGATEGNQVALMRALMEYNGADPARKPDAARKLQAQAAQYRTFLEGSELIALCEANPFGVAVDIRGPLGAALDRIEETVSG